MTPETERDGYPMRDWWDIAESLQHQTFQVRRPKSSGTAFLVSQTTESDSPYRHFCFATAWHVIADLWDDDRFILYRSGDKAVIEIDTNHVIRGRLDPPFDLGLFIVRTASAVLPPEKMMPVRGLKTFPSLGEDLAWCGYPGSLEQEPMFCRGTLACIKTKPHCYLINGVAYPGMSGGAVVDRYGWVVGVVSEWWEDGAIPQIPGMLQAAPSAMIRHVLEKTMAAKVLDNRPQHPPPN